MLPVGLFRTQQRSPDLPTCGHAVGLSIGKIHLSESIESTGSNHWTTDSIVARFSFIASLQVWLLDGLNASNTLGLLSRSGTDLFSNPVSPTLHCRGLANHKSRHQPPTCFICLKVRSTALTISLQCRLQIDRWAPTFNLNERFFRMFFVRSNHLSNKMSRPASNSMTRRKQNLVPGGTLSRTRGLHRGVMFNMRRTGSLDAEKSRQVLPAKAL
ncbi:hypothetical protein BDW62DRAFT_183504 [Aspergillus aurantiobrunneus]